MSFIIWCLKYSDMTLGIIYNLITIIFYSFLLSFQMVILWASFLYNKRKLYKYRCNNTEFSQRRFIAKRGGAKEQNKYELGKVNSYEVHSQFCNKMKQRRLYEKPSEKRPSEKSRNKLGRPQTQCLAVRHIYTRWVPPSLTRSISQSFFFFNENTYHFITRTTLFTKAKTSPKQKQKSSLLD